MSMQMEDLKYQIAKLKVENKKYELQVRKQQEQIEQLTKKKSVVE